MKKFKKVVIFLLCTLILFSLVACGKSSTGNTASKSTTTAKEATKDPLAEHLNISWLAFWCAGLSPDNWAQKEIEKMFNVTVTVPDVDANADTQKLDIMIASGEMPDFAVFSPAYSKMPYDLYNQKVTRSIPISMIKQYAPNYTKLMDANPAGWKIYGVPGSSTDIMAMTGFNPNQSSYPYYGSFYRLDWLENLGIKPHGTLQNIDKNGKEWIASEAFTRDELLNILDKFTNGDPDKNGKNDTIGTIGSSFIQHTWYSIMGSFGINELYSMEDNGKAVYYYSTEKYKNFLKFAADIYKKGYIDPEFLMNDFAKMGEKYSKGSAGYASTVSSYMNSDPGYASRAPMAMIKDNPNGKIVMCPPEIGLNKEQGVPLYSATPFNYRFYISNKTDDKKLARILQIFDYSAASKEGYLKFYWGEEGTHYKVVSNDGLSYRQVLDGIKLGGKTGLGIFATSMVLPNDGRSFTSSIDDKNLKDVLNSSAWLKYNITPYRYDLTSSTDLAKVQTQYKPAIDTLVKEFYSKAITGQINIDNEWNNYISNLNKAGYDKIVQELNKAPLYKDLMSGK